MATRTPSALRLGPAYVPAATNPGVLDEVEREAADYGAIPNSTVT
jgi:hypothetical protein